MSFGVGVGDVVLVTSLAWRLYKNSKESSEHFRSMSTELMALHAVLSEICDFVEEHGDELEDSRKNRLNLLMQGCQGSLQELDALYHRYESLATQRQRTWDRMCFGLKDLSDVRQRLISCTTSLTSFIAALINASTARIEKRLIKMVTEIQAGMREKSVVANSDIADTIDSPEFWPELRKELDDLGISAVVAEERHEYIIAWLKDAAASGMLDENARMVGNDDASTIYRTSIATGDDDNSRSSTPGFDESASIRSLTPTNDSDDRSTSYHSAHSDLNHISEHHLAVPRREVISMSASSTAFDAEVQRMRVDRSVADLLAPLAASTAYSLPPPTYNLSPSSASFSSSSPTLVRSPRRRTFGLVSKLFQKQTAIVQAASDGDIDRVARLLSMGMDVNAVDRWGWSALSMCGYGGHAAIARLLLDHGAKIDNVDVDNDTPMSLAEQRGHADVVIMLEEEAAIRQLRDKEAAQSRTRSSSSSSSLTLSSALFRTKSTS